MNRADIAQMAQAAGFGANLRNTHAVKLELFAVAVRHRVYSDAAAWMLDTVAELAEGGAPDEAIESAAAAAGAFEALARNSGIAK